MPSSSLSIVTCALAAILSSVAIPASAVISLGADFATDYSLASIGSVPGVPVRYGGLTFLDPSTILTGGDANVAAGKIYEINVSRGSDNHITGFSGTAVPFRGASATIGAFNDGGVAFGPNGVLFTARWPVNQVG